MGLQAEIGQKDVLWELFFVNLRGKTTPNFKKNTKN
jgi:hypothetical protein